MSNKTISIAQENKLLTALMSAAIRVPLILTV